MTTTERNSMIEKVAFSRAISASENDPVNADIAKHGIWFGTHSIESCTTAGFTKHSFAGHMLRRTRLVFQLFKIRAKRLVLGIKISALTLHCRVFGLNESDALLEDRSRAMLVDQFLQKIKHRAFSVR